jgi:hypothetical protein
VKLPWGLGLAAFAVGVGWFAFASPRGDLTGHWTDHLRHQGEAIALLERGPAIYREAYVDAVREVRVPCEVHRGLWDGVGIPYPPLGVLLHLPLATAERAQLIAPATSHKGQVVLSLLAAMAAVWLALRFVRGHRLLTGWVVLWLAPLVIGAGACGFYDVFFVLTAMFAFSRPIEAWGWRAVSAALHPRGFIALSLGAFTRPSRREVALLLVCALSTIGVAVTVALNTPPLPFDNWLHLTRRGWIVLVLSAAALAALFWRHRRITWSLAFPMLTASALILIAPQRGWWHLLPSALVPLSVRAEPPETQLAAMAWSVAVSFFFLRSAWPAPLFWISLG